MAWAVGEEAERDAYSCAAVAFFDPEATELGEKVWVDQETQCLRDSWSLRRYGICGWSLDDPSLETTRPIS